MLEYHPLREQPTAPQRRAELLQEFRQLLEQDGMASMDEYGDMLKWGLPSRDGWCRYFHAYHPNFCTWSDQFFGTVHTHGGTIRGTILLGAMDHSTYEATPDPSGDRSHGGQRYTLAKHTTPQVAGTSYELAANVPHWLRPTDITLTYFEEEDNEAMGELVNRDTEETDQFRFEQKDADAMAPELLRRIDAALKQLLVPV